ncbi:hypothetical protein, partial [Achromobacter xylosoxidans]|uniref:hypothetical protein n=1 Tax=Alcaligenes xylosoxydans xylosoxydans TaxID=85698 RepID=UPI001F145EED
MHAGIGIRGGRGLGRPPGRRMGRRQKSEPDLSARLWATVYCKGAGEKGGAAGDGGARASEDGRTGASDFQGKV